MAAEVYWAWGHVSYGWLLGPGFIQIAGWLLGPVFHLNRWPAARSWLHTNCLGRVLGGVIGLAKMRLWAGGHHFQAALKGI